MIDHIFFEPLIENREVVEIAAVRTNRKGVHFEAFSEKVKTKHLEGTPLEDAIVMMTKRVLNEKYSDDYVVVVYKVPPTHNDFHKYLPKAWISLATLAWPLAYGGMIPSLTLDAISKYHGIVNKASGTAEGNVVTIMDTYWQLMRRYKTALTAEEGLRSVAGDGVEGFRRILGF